MHALRALAALAALAAAAAAVRGGLVFTGDAAADFGDETIEASGRRRNAGALFVADAAPAARVVYDASAAGRASVSVAPDVGVPADWRDDVTSGFDIARLYFQYDADADSLHVGIECFGVCGDADGDGNPSRSSPRLVVLGGVDLADLAQGEAFVVALDLDLDAGNASPAPFDFLLGVPAGDAPARLGLPPLPCAAAAGVPAAERFSATRCFGLYHYARADDVNLAQRAASPVLGADGRTPWPATNHNPSPSLGRPSLEWTVHSVAALRASVGAPFAAAANDAEARANEPWSFNAAAFAGSFADDGVGEDFVPAAAGRSFVRVDVPCRNADACGVCGGDSTSCADCDGVANGSARYDACGVCGGDDATCADCAGVANGSAAYDRCDVCGGDGASCVDCAGVPLGSAAYDGCGVCGGDNATCADCAGVPHGSAAYDVCDVCDGDGTSCCGVQGRPCCVNYCGVPDAYWDYLLLPVTLDSLIDKFRFTQGVLEWLCEHLPPFDAIAGSSGALHIGRMAEFNRLFIDDCLEELCEASATLYTQLVLENGAAAAAAATAASAR